MAPPEVAGPELAPDVVPGPELLELEPELEHAAMSDAAASAVRARAAGLPSLTMPVLLYRFISYHFLVPEGLFLRALGAELPGLGAELPGFEVLGAELLMCVGGAATG